MQFLSRQITKSVKLVYGFKKEEPRYSLIATLFEKDEYTEIYGLLSRELLSIQDFKDFWYFIQTQIETKYICFEVIPGDAKVYKKFLSPIEIKTVKTFNGYDAEQLIILKNQKIKFES
jgi:hypothetical protein